MKGFIFFFALFVVAAAAADLSFVNKENLKEDKNIVDEVEALKECMIHVVELLEQISEDVLTLVRGLEGMTQDFAENTKACGEGIDSPTISQQIQIAQCIRQVYQEFAFDLLTVIHDIQASIHTIEQVPGIIDECLHPSF